MGYFGTLEHTKVLGVGAGAAGTQRRPAAPAARAAAGASHTLPGRARAHTPCSTRHSAQMTMKW